MNDSHLTQAVKAIEVEDYPLAIELLVPLAQQKNSEAIGMLGLVYHLGLGVEVDGLKAVELLTQSMELGSGTAAHNLGTLYCGGAPGVAPNRVRAKAFYKRAKDMGAQYADDEFYL